MDPNKLTNNEDVDVYLAYADNVDCVRWVAVAGATSRGGSIHERIKIESSNIDHDPEPKDLCLKRDPTRPRFVLL